MTYQDKFIIGVDFGEARTGLALGKNGAVTPVRSVVTKDKMQVIAHVSYLAKEAKAALVVLGLPLNSDGKETRESLEIRKFARLLRSRLGVPVVFVDESGTTAEAQGEAVFLDLPVKLRKKVDSISAALILKRFFAEEGM